jgi:Domain of unknown function DUF29
LRVLLTHLIEWPAQADRRSASWNGSIAEQRQRIRRLLLQHPSLRKLLPEMIEATYGRAKAVAAAETGLSPRRFPGKCPFPVAEIIDPDFLPE